MKKYITKKLKESLSRRVFSLPSLAGRGWGRVLGLGLLAMTMTSCNDFLTIYPTDRIVGQDFWKTKSDVDQMVDGVYKSMLDYSIQTRAIMWGAYRSDELVKRSDLSDQTLDNIDAVNLLPTMSYCSWSAFYHVINNCNVVLKHAPEVMEEDPEFTQGDYQTVRAQMLSLRSLCYFYLVRAFRDVPYMEEAIEDDSQIEPVAQSTPAVVLQHCIDDLNEALPYLMKSGAFGYGDWRNYGYITRDAANALLADIYLWRAAMTHSKSDYQQVVTLTERVITAKDEYFKANSTSSNIGTGFVDRYHLLEEYMYMYIFTRGNAPESILEWQYNGRNNANTAIRDYYYNNDEKERKNSIVMASPVFNSAADNADTEQGQKIYLSTNDYRMWNNVYDAGEAEAEQLGVRKMVTTSPQPMLENTSKTYSRDFKEFQQNWVVYRLTDVMLMQAEALVELATDDTDQATLQKAFDLVDAVNKRAMTENATDVLDFTKYNTKEKMEVLVLNERERELCFEGKRWFDLLRYSYRHMTGTDINSLMADQTVWPETYQPMLKMIVRKYGDGGLGAAVYKMKTEPFFYWPIQESETKVNSLLKQNPVWEQEKSTSKN
ncbi:RagB/SusD family nutrient uptake outer membrane protein [Prevotella sp. E9-3]|uniref:RagB/SusD family nutrient uptake outer membrane protein n=1 Tax=Prevotella sp. E9-3 TaxID=2913621 RepID=UPI001EDC4A4E|nr:RagB/SusD family nutrient uptake outer membrane protein [Prevotella sp. E9-3]UKK48363.1 RagB/SusD family nutrient uptake outer membrane protein [Prevotella sp. E9-3]